MRDVKGPVFERREFPRESAAHAKAPGVGSRLSMLKEYEETSCVCSKVVKTRYLQMRIERGQKLVWLRSCKLCKNCSFYWYYYVGHRQSPGKVIGIEEVARFYGLQRKKSCPTMQAGASVGLSLGLWLETKPGLSSQGLLV